MTHPDRHLLDGHVRDWNDPRPAGMYFTLHHGRDNPKQEMNGMGYDGPIIGPLKWCHVAYCSTFDFGFVGSVEADTGPGTVVSIIDDLVLFDGKYYGDWEFQLLEEQT